MTNRKKAPHVTAKMVMDRLRTVCRGLDESGELPLAFIVDGGGAIHADIDNFQIDDLGQIHIFTKEAEQ